MIDMKYSNIPGANWFSKEPVIVCHYTHSKLFSMTPSCLRQANLQLNKHFEALTYLPATPPNRNIEYYFGQVILDLAFYLLNAVRGCINTKRIIVDKNGSHLILGYHDFYISKTAFSLAFKLYQNILDNKPLQFEYLVNNVQQLLSRCKQQHPDYQAAFLIDYANTHNISVNRVFANRNYWRFGTGKGSVLFRESLSEFDSCVGSEISRDKYLTSKYLTQFNLPVPKQVLITGPSIPREVLSEPSKYVIKPVDSSKGNGITIKPINKQTLMKAMTVARKCSPKKLVIAEEFVLGEDYRILIVNKKVMAIAKRVPPYVIGNGIDTVADLVCALNAKRNSVPVTRKYYRTLIIDDDVTQNLLSQAVTEASILEVGRIVYLRFNANMSTGGTVEDHLMDAHPDVIKMCEKLARLFPLNTFGLDYITTNISQSPIDTDGKILEINTTPGLDVHISSPENLDKIMNALFMHVKNSVFVTVAVVPANKIEKDKSYLTGTNINQDTYYMVENTIYSEDITEFTTLTSAINFALHDSNCKELYLVFNENHFLSYGLPSIYIHQVTYLDISTKTVELLAKTAKSIKADLVNVDYLTCTS